jgi:hypothetical protein
MSADYGGFAPLSDASGGTGHGHAALACRCVEQLPVCPRK